MADIRDKQTDPKDRLPTSRNPSGGSSQLRPAEAVPPAPKFALRQEPAAEPEAPADDNRGDVPLPSLLPEESAAPEFGDRLLESRPLDISSSPPKHGDPDAMFSVVTRGLIRVERRKVFRRRFKWYATGLVFLSVVAAAAYAVWRYEPDWALQWLSTDWRPDFLRFRR